LRLNRIGLSYSRDFRHALQKALRSRVNHFQERLSDMGDVVNLNRYRKLRDKRNAERDAKENRAKFGRTQAERLNDRRKAERREKDLTDKELGQDTENSETPDAG
jgi:hypothetical protein